MVKIRSWIARLLIAVLLCGIFPVYLAQPPAVFASDAYDALRSKYMDYLTGGSLLNLADPDVAKKVEEVTSAAQSAWSTMITTPGRITLWDDIQNIAADSGQLSKAYGRIRSMALAYRTDGSPLYGNTDMRDDILGGLQFLYAYYNEDSTIKGNWWFWEIGIPQALGETMIFMYDDVPKVKTADAYDIIDYGESVDNFFTDPTKMNNNQGPATGANRVWRAEGFLNKGIVLKSSDNIALTRDMLSQVFEYVTTGDGFYEDGSFLQHKAHPFTMGYGTVLIEVLSKMLYLFHDSQWEVTDPNKENVFAWVRDSFELAIYNGKAIPSLRGRQIATGAGTNTFSLISALLSLNESGDAATRSYLQGLMLHWTSYFKDMDQELYSQLSLTKLIWFKRFSGSAQASQQTTRLKLWGSMNRTIKQTPEYAFELAAFSSRVYDFEAINNENLQGWFYGTGATYIHTNDINQYGDGYFALVNPYRVPGITVVKDTAFNFKGTYTSRKDAFVRAGSYSGTNYGTNANLDVKSAPGTDYIRNSYLEFEPQMDSAAVISAKLRLYGRNMDNTDSTGISVLGTKYDEPSVDPDAWSEAAITWEAPPLNTSTTVLDTVYVNAEEKYYEWDVTEYVRAEVSRNRKLTFQLFSADPSSPLVSFRSKESSANKPELVVIKAASSNYGGFSWSGGAQLDDLYGAVGMQFGQKQQTLTGKKSWFIFDNEIVALGSDIDSTDQKTIETIVDNRKLPDPQDAAFKLNGAAQNMSLGTEYDYSGITSASLTNSAGVGDMGYYFPGGTAVKAKLERKTGSYKDTNWANGSPELLTRDFLNLWFDHGVSPTDASYQYVLLPAFNSSQTESYAENPEITILENSAEAHAVKENLLNMTGINFWNDKVKTVGNVTSNKKASVMVKETETAIEIAVSDPTFGNTGTIDITVDSPLYSVISKDPEVTVTRLGDKAAFQVNVNGAAGKTFHITLAKTVAWDSQAVYSGQHLLGVVNGGKIVTEFDLIPGQNGINGVLGYAPAASGPEGAADLDLAFQLTADNQIKALNGSSWISHGLMAYAAGTAYHALVAVDAASGTYDAWVKPAGGAYTQVARQYSLRHGGAPVDLGLLVLHSPDNGAYRVENHQVSVLQESQAAPAEDMFISGAAPGTNYGSAASIVVKDASGTAFDRMVWMKFDLNPYNTVYNSSLNFYVSAAGPAAAPLNIYGVPGDSWNESASTWSSPPDRAGEVLIGTVSVPSVGWYSLDVTGFIQSQKTENGWSSFRIADEANTNVTVNINSRESTSMQPYLTVEHMAAPALPAAAEPPVAASLVATPATVALAVGESATVTVVVYDQNHQPISGVPLGWLSDNAAVASVNNGVITAVGAGNTVIHAVYGSLSTAVSVIVIAPDEPGNGSGSTASIIEVYPAAVALVSGESATVTVVVYDQNHQPISGVPLGWLSDNAAVASVNNGVITAVGAGNTVIHAVYGSLSAAVSVAVAVPHVPEGPPIIIDDGAGNSEDDEIYHELGTIKVSERMTVLTVSPAKLSALSSVAADSIVINAAAIGETPVNAVDIPAQDLSGFMEAGKDLIIHFKGASLRLPQDALALDGIAGRIRIALSDEGGALPAGGSLSAVSGSFSFSIQADGRDMLLLKPVEATLKLSAAYDYRKTGVYEWDKGRREWSYAGGKISKDRNSIVLQMANPTGTVYAAFAFNKAFADVPITHWARDSIEVLAARHLIDGISDESFNPQKSVTRAEFAAIAARVLSLPFTTYAGEYADVEADAWYADVIAAAVQAGILEGDETGIRPGDPISRQEMSVVIMRVLEKLNQASAGQETINGSDNGSPFADQDEIAPWARKAVAHARQIGLVNGKSDRVFSPQANTTRAETAAIFYRLLEKSGLF